LRISNVPVRRLIVARPLAPVLGARPEMQTLATFTRTAQEHFAEIRKGLTEALTKRDAEYGDYRTSDKQ